jgi:transposase
VIRRKTNRRHMIDDHHGRTTGRATLQVRAGGRDSRHAQDVIHLFNQKGLAALDPRWAGGRPRLISDDDVEVIVAAARTRPEKLGQPFTHWSLRKLAGYLAGRDRPVRIGRERLRQILHARGISFQRTRTWKESTDPDKEAKLDRIEYVTGKYPDRCFAFDQFGPLSIGPATGPAGRRANGLPGCAPPTTAPTGSATSTAVTAWAMTSCGGVTRRRRAPITPGPR